MLMKLITWCFLRCRQTVEYSAYSSKSEKSKLHWVRARCARVRYMLVWKTGINLATVDSYIRRESTNQMFVFVCIICAVIFSIDPNSRYSHDGYCSLVCPECTCARPIWVDTKCLLDVFAWYLCYWLLFIHWFLYDPISLNSLCVYVCPVHIVAICPRHEILIKGMS